MSIDDTAAPYVLEGTFGQPAEPAPPSMAPPEYVNEGLARWNAGRQAWLEQTKGSGATTRPRPKDLEVDEVIETIFSLDGLGRMGFEAAVARDYPVIFGTLFVFGLMGLVVGILSDLMYVFVDPRIDFERREG